MSAQVVANHVARSPHQVAHGAEHGSVAHSPYVEEVVNQPFECEAHIACRHAALGAAATIEAVATVIADVVLMQWLGHRHGLFLELAHVVPPHPE